MTQIKKYKWWLVAGLAVLVVFLLAKLATRKFDIENNGAALVQGSGQPGLISGAKCENYNSRPVAVMISSDKEARPLSGISEADLVFEMPVVNNGFTRMMAVFQCNQPTEIGSVRSARLDFLPLVLGLDAIYAHFGGEYEALQRLNAGIIDNIDGLKYDGTIYYRKSGIPRPHNAFTSSELLGESADELSYARETDVKYFEHLDKDESQGGISPPLLYGGEFEVEWQYNPETNAYLRSRGQEPESDKNNNRQVEAKNVVIMKTSWSPVNKDYIRVKTVGGGGALIYQNGKVINGFWRKNGETGKLIFTDLNQEEILFAPGPIWIEIIILQIN